jgi:hypothetical protein
VPPEPEHEPGTLIDAVLHVANVGGNHVRSYLDIVAPDGLGWSEIQDVFERFVNASRATPLPWAAIIERCRFRVGMELALARNWRKELGLLYVSCALVHARSAP